MSFADWWSRRRAKALQRREEAAAKEERRRVEIEEHLARAIAHADAKNPKKEERALFAALQRSGWSGMEGTQRRIRELQRQRKVRRAKFLGRAGDVLVYSDRIVVYVEGKAPRIHTMRGDVKARVESGGQILQSSRPTLTRMALGSALPGTALIPGFAFQKTSTDDRRELYFWIGGSDWEHVSRADPNLGAEMRSLATAVSEAARKSAARSGQRSS